MAKRTCCSCWQSVADQILMVQTFVVTMKKFGSCGVRLHITQRAFLQFSVLRDGTVHQVKSSLTLNILK